ncbi:MAG: class I SAM-dependent methyltransferase [Blastochloris sp.]|nr:class I SAM-dependent methyltransferase [Blastochloris sp.]
MQQLQEISGYIYEKPDLNESHNYLLPTTDLMLSEFETKNPGRRLIDVGCGNGSVADHYRKRGYDVLGIDPSEAGIKIAKQHYPHLQLYQDSAYSDLRKYGTFDVVISLEVVEHLYNPRLYAQNIFNACAKDGIVILSTPYHGYFKNLALALTNRMDKHFTALWDHGHIKFWSVKTLSTLLIEAGFRDLKFRNVGRIPLLAKSMVVSARRA